MLSARAAAGTTERRPYCPAMQQLVGSGEPAPDLFGVLHQKGAPSRLAEASARGAGIPLGEAIRRMRDELAALPEG